MPDLTLCLLVHAGAKIGKSTLGATTPTPRLIIDAEGSTQYLPVKACYWDPATEAPPKMDDPTECDTCIVKVRGFNTLSLVHQWLQSGQHAFKSLTIDSLTMIQRLYKGEQVGLDAPDLQEWGRIFSVMDKEVRDLRDLTDHPTNPLSAVVLICETKQDNSGKWRPYVQGQLSTSLPYIPDVIGYLYRDNIPNELADGAITQVNRLLISPHPQFEAGERVQGRLGTVITQPNVADMLRLLNQPPQPTESE